MRTASGSDRATPRLVGVQADQCPAGQLSCPTQQYYHVPTAWLSTDGDNLLTVFASLGAAMDGSTPLARLAVASMGAAGAGKAVDPTHITSCEM